MSDSLSHAEIINQITHLLVRLQLDDALEHKPFRVAFLDLIQQSAESRNFRAEVFNRLDAPRRKRPRKSSEPLDSDASDIQRSARQLLNGEQQRARGRSSTKIDHLVQAVGSLDRGCTFRHSDFDQLKQANRHQCITNRQQAVLIGIAAAEQQTHVAEATRRLLMIQIDYEVHRLRMSAERQDRSGSRTVESDVSAAEREFSNLSGSAPDHIRALRKRSRAYLEFAQYENGLGVLLMLGPESRRLWETSIAKVDVPWIWKFCEDELPGFIEKAASLQLVACKIVESGLIESGADPAELREDGHIFSKHFLSSRTEVSESGSAVPLTVQEEAQISYHPLQEGGRGQLQTPTVVPKDINAQKYATNGHATWHSMDKVTPTDSSTDRSLPAADDTWSWTIWDDFPDPDLYSTNCIA